MELNHKPCFIEKKSFYLIMIFVILFFGFVSALGPPLLPTHVQGKVIYQDGRAAGGQIVEITWYSSEGLSQYKSVVVLSDVDAWRKGNNNLAGKYAVDDGSILAPEGSVITISVAGKKAYVQAQPGRQVIAETIMLPLEEAHTIGTGREPAGFLSQTLIKIENLVYPSKKKESTPSSLINNSKNLLNNSRQEIIKNSSLGWQKENFSNSEYKIKNLNSSEKDSLLTNPVSIPPLSSFAKDISEPNRLLSFLSNPLFSSSLALLMIILFVFVILIRREWKAHKEAIEIKKQTSRRITYTRASSSTLQMEKALLASSSFPEVITLFSEKSLDAAPVLSYQGVAGEISEHEVLNSLPQNNQDNKKMQAITRRAAATASPNSSLSEVMQSLARHKTVLLMENDSIKGSVDYHTIGVILERVPVTLKKAILIKDVPWRTPLFVDSKQTISELRKIFIDRRMDYALVLDNQEVIGVVSTHDILKAYKNGLNFSMNSVAQIMTRSFFHVASNTEVSSTIRFMKEHRFRYIPIIEQGNIEGVVFLGDMIQTYYKALEDADKTLGKTKFKKL